MYFGMTYNSLIKEVKYYRVFNTFLFIYNNPWISLDQLIGSYVCIDETDEEDGYTSILGILQSEENILDEVPEIIIEHMKEYEDESN